MLPQQLADNRPPAMDGDKPRQTPAGLRQGLPSWRHRWSGSQATSGQSEAAAGQRNTPAQRQPLGVKPGPAPVVRPWVSPAYTGAGVLTAAPPRAPTGTQQYRHMKRSYVSNQQPQGLGAAKGTTVTPASRSTPTFAGSHAAPHGTKAPAPAAGGLLWEPARQAQPTGQSVDLILRGRAMRIHPSSSSAPAASAAGNGGEPGPEAFESGEGADLATEGSSPAAAHVGISCGLQTHLTIAEQLLERHGLLDSYKATLAASKAGDPAHTSGGTAAGIDVVSGAGGLQSRAPATLLDTTEPGFAAAGVSTPAAAPQASAPTAIAAAPEAVVVGAPKLPAVLLSTLSTLSSIDSLLGSYKVPEPERSSSLPPASGCKAGQLGREGSLQSSCTWSSSLGGSYMGGRYQGASAAGGAVLHGAGVVGGMMCTLRNPLYRLHSDAASSILSGSSTGGLQSSGTGGRWQQQQHMTATRMRTVADVLADRGTTTQAAAGVTAVAAGQQHGAAGCAEQATGPDSEGHATEPPALAVTRGREVLQWLLNTLPASSAATSASGDMVNCGSLGRSLAMGATSSLEASNTGSCSTHQASASTASPAAAVVTGGSEALSVDTGELQDMLQHVTGPNFSITTRMDGNAAALLQPRQPRSRLGAACGVEQDPSSAASMDELQPIPEAAGSSSEQPGSDWVNTQQALQGGTAGRVHHVQRPQRAAPGVLEGTGILPPGAMIYEWVPLLLSSLPPERQGEVLLAADAYNAALVEQLGEAEGLLAEAGLLGEYHQHASAAVLGASALLSLAATYNSSSRGSTADNTEERKMQRVRQWGVTAAASAWHQPVPQPTGHFLDPFPDDPDMEARTVWQPSHKSGAPVPLVTVWSPAGLLLFLAYLAAMVYYFVVRIRYSLDLGWYTWYGIVILVAEGIGVTAVVPYALMLTRRTVSTGSPGLPRDDGTVVLPWEKRFHIRILVPCYKESLGIIMATVSAALEALVPPGCRRTLYLCDDGKDDAKRRYVASLGPDAVYVTGRVRQKGEINGKSANLNHCLKQVIYAGISGPDDIPQTEVLCVFDADMVAQSNFLRKVLEVMWDDTTSLCLTPQAFKNIPPAADLFNAINPQFWEVVLPGCDALGYVACTGTNFCLRAHSLAKVGWFPSYTITEDYALSMELKAAGCKGRYLPEYLAVGEAPDEVRGVMRQRSRWCKGHMQVFFSSRCPLFHRKLSPLYWVLYTNGTWAYFTTVITTIVFVMIPFNSLVLGVHPVTFSWDLTLASTLYLVVGAAVSNWVPGLNRRRLLGMYMSGVCNHLLTPTYFKAILNTLMSILGLKAQAGFKATEKKVAAAAAAVQAAAASLRASLTQTFRGAHGTMRGTVARYGSTPLTAISEGGTDAGSAAASTGSGRTEHSSGWVSSGNHGSTAGSSARTAGSSKPASRAGGGGSRSPTTEGVTGHPSPRQPSRLGRSTGPGPLGEGSLHYSMSLESDGILASHSINISSDGVMSQNGGTAPRETAGSHRVTDWSPAQTVVTQQQLQSGDEVLWLSADGSQDTRPATTGTYSELRAVQGSSLLGQNQPLQTWAASTHDHGQNRFDSVLFASEHGSSHADLAGVPAAISGAGGAHGATATAADASVKAYKRVSKAAAGAGTKPEVTKPPAPGAEQPPEHALSWFVTNWQANWRAIDMWVLLLSVCISGTALGAGAWAIAQRDNRFAFATAQGASKVFITGHLDEFMLLAMVWSAYNLLPPLLFWVYMFNRGHLVQAASNLAHVLSGVLLAGAIVLLWLLVPIQYNLGTALQYSSNFLDAQRATSPLMPLPDSTAAAYPWLPRAGALVEDVVPGGFYMSGTTYVKHTFPQAHTMALLAWGLLTYGDSAAVAQPVVQQLQGTLAYGSRYLLAARPGPNQLVVQVGDPQDYVRNLTAATGFWGLPSAMPPNRAPYVLNISSPAAADVWAATAAALAAASLQLKTTHPDLSAEALSLAKVLYAEAVAARPQPNVTHCRLVACEAWGPPQQGDVPAQLLWQGFPSTTALDDMAWAAAWLHTATGEDSYLVSAKFWLGSHWELEARWQDATYYQLSTDHVAPAAAVLLQAALADRPGEEFWVQEQLQAPLRNLFRGWMTGKSNMTAVVSPTPAGAPFFAPTPLPAAAGMSALALLYAQAAGGQLVGKQAALDLECFALRRVLYMLGATSTRRSYLVGCAAGRPQQQPQQQPSWPVQPSHQQASCPPKANCSVANALLSPGPNPWQLTGALVLGPEADDSYPDVRVLNGSAVGLHHNTPLVVALMGLQARGTSPGRCQAGTGLLQTVTHMPWQLQG